MSNTLEDTLDQMLPWRADFHTQSLEFITPPAGLDFDRPFWHMTMEDLLREDKREQLDKTNVSFDELRHLVGDREPNPTGMIFHIGRCGSTLVSRMVGHDRTQLVLRESAPIGGLHRSSAGSDLVPTFAIEQAFRDTLVAFDRFAETRSQRVVVKHSSWESFSMGRVSELLPNTPLVFVYRDPFATIASSLDGHPGWAPRLHQPRMALQRWVPWLDKLEQPFNAAAIYASVWAAGAEAALTIPAGKVLLIDHAWLSAEPAAALSALQRHLGLDLDQDRALSELGQYSKAKTDGTEFDPSGSHSRPPLSARTKAQVRDIVGDLPDRLAARLSQQAASNESKI